MEKQQCEYIILTQTEKQEIDKQILRYPTTNYPTTFFIFAVMGFPWFSVWESRWVWPKHFVSSLTQSNQLFIEHPICVVPTQDWPCLEKERSISTEVIDKAKYVAVTSVDSLGSLSCAARQKVWWRREIAVLRPCQDKSACLMLHLKCSLLAESLQVYWTQQAAIKDRKYKQLWTSPTLIAVHL